MAEEKGVWRTVRGRRIFIREGEDLASAMEKSGKFKNELKKENKDKELSESFTNRIKTQKQLKELIDNGLATDITTYDENKTRMLDKKHGRLEKVQITKGVYGMNGALLRSRETGEYFVITSQNLRLLGKKGE